MTVIRESLLRAPLFPDPEADQGIHHLVTVYLPGATLAETIDQGYAANLPRRTLKGGAPVEPLVRVDNPGVKVEAVKLAQDRSGDVVVRLYEAMGRRTTAHVAAAFPATHVHSTDLLERPDGKLTVEGGCADVSLRPFEIVTLRFHRG